MISSCEVLFGACEESGPPVNAQQLQAQSQLQAQRVLGIRSDKSKGGGHGGERIVKILNLFLHFQTIECWFNSCLMFIYHIMSSVIDSIDKHVDDCRCLLAHQANRAIYRSALFIDGSDHERSCIMSDLRTQTQKVIFQRDPAWQVLHGLWRGVRISIV